MPIEVILATGAAVVAALAAYWSARVSQRAEQRASDAEAKSSPDLNVYLVDAFRHFDQERKVFLYAFSAVVTNRSSEPNSIDRVELSLHAHLPNSTRIVHSFQHDPARSESLPQRVLSAFRAPQYLAASQTSAGWALFEVPAHILDTHLIEFYRLGVVNSRGAPGSADVYIVKELHEVLKAEAP